MNSGNVQVAMLCLVMLKKYFLDPRAATQLEPAQLEQLREAIQASIEFVEQPIQLLKRKADVLSKVYWKLGKNQELVGFIAQAAGMADQVKARQFAMYTFEVMSEVTLDSE